MFDVRLLTVGGAILEHELGDHEHLWSLCWISGCFGQLGDAKLFGCVLAVLAQGIGLDFLGGWSCCDG